MSDLKWTPAQIKLIWKKLFTALHQPISEESAAILRKHFEQPPERSYRIPIPEDDVKKVLD